MIPFLLLLFAVYGRYQFLAEKDVLEVVTVPKADAMTMVSSMDEPSYIITKHRHHYNCTNTFKDYSERKEDSRFLIISKDLLKQRVFSGSGLFGRITVTPMSNVVLTSNGDDVSHFIIDQSLIPEERFGEKHISPAKFTEFYRLKDESEGSVSKLKISYQCHKSVIFEVEDLSAVDYTLTVNESSKEHFHITISSNSYCMDQEEDNGFKEINRRLYSLDDSPKTQFTSNNWQYVIYHKQNITQKYVSTEQVFNIGFYNLTATKNQGYNVVRRFRPSDPEDPYLNLIFDGGEKCGDTGDNRTANLHLVCPSSPGVLTDSVIETSHCHYEVYTGSPWVCNLPWMKKQQRRKRYIVCYDMDETDSALSK